MFYIAYDKDNQTFYVTKDLGIGVIVNGSLFDSPDEGTALDFAEEFTRTLNKEGNLCTTIHYCPKRDRYLVSVGA